MATTIPSVASEAEAVKTKKGMTATDVVKARCEVVAMKGMSNGEMEDTKAGSCRGKKANTLRTMATTSGRRTNGRMDGRSRTMSRKMATTMCGAGKLLRSSCLCSC